MWKACEGRDGAQSSVWNPVPPVITVPHGGQMEPSVPPVNTVPHGGQMEPSVPPVNTVPHGGQIESL